MRHTEGNMGLGRSAIYGNSNTKDKLFLLSENEVKMYFDSKSDRIAKYNGFESLWWLRDDTSSLYSLYVSSFAPVVKSDGEFSSGIGVDVNIELGVRPAIWVELE